MADGNKPGTNPSTRRDLLKVLAELSAQHLKLQGRFDILVTFVIGGVLVLGSYFLNNNLAAKVAQDLGTAVIVGGIIGFTLERRSKERTEHDIRQCIHRVGDNLIGAVYGKDIPGELFEVTKSSIFEQPFIRYNFENYIKLHDLNEAYIKTQPEKRRLALEKFISDLQGSEVPQNLVVLDSTMRYHVENVSRREETLAFLYTLDTALPAHSPGLSGIKSISKDGEQLVKDGDYMSDHDSYRSKDHMVEYKDDFEFKPGQRVFFEVRGFTLRLNYDKESWFLVHPQHGVRIEVEDADGNKDITISLRAPELSNDQRVVNKSPSTNVAILRTDQFLLPYQGIHIKWALSEETARRNGNKEIKPRRDHIKADDSSVTR